MAIAVIARIAILAVDRNAFSAGGQYSCSMASRDQFMCTITQSGYQAIIAAAALRFRAMACCFKRHSIARPAHRPRSNSAESSQTRVTSK